MANLEALKKEAALKALEHVRSGMFIGLGSGSTAKHFIAELGQKLASAELKNITAVATSKASDEQARALKIPMLELSGQSLVENLSKRELIVNLKGRELSNSKNYSIQFLTHLKPLEKFEIETGYFIKDTPTTRGMDYLIGMLSFDRPVDHFIATIEFKDFTSEKLIVLDIGNHTETVLYPKEAIGVSRFVFSTGKGNTNFLNYLRLIFLYERS